MQLKDCLDYLKMFERDYIIEQSKAQKAHIQNLIDELFRLKYRIQFESEGNK